MKMRDTAIILIMEGFFGLLREWLKNNIVNVHTLNHDLFFDFISSRLT
jgi:hypothetical protein